ncbi:SLBB domain-containing protein [Phenylobacterium sp.]|uniref:SLBB domain-containing protein n=1 Tax=Phenylobacterium sp. TaxID=1871053 RepID=UPI00286AF6ED|nr:SLBB domain-containing protein [Phenylobacterium sp.]
MASSGDRSYVLGVGDTVEVSVLGRTDFNTRGRIGTDGAVLLPYLGATPAVNRSPGQLADEIRAALERGGYFAQPAVRVDVVGVASRFVTVLGSVTNPGLMPLDRQYHLSEIVARAGGRSAAGADFVLLTRGSEPPQKFKIADLATGAGDKDPVVETGDRIYVPAAEAEVFYITGAVKAPGAFPVTTDLTVRMAMARAGGVSDTGNENKISINRKGKIIKGVKPDTDKVEPGDIISVGEKLF